MLLPSFYRSATAGAAALLAAAAVSPVSAATACNNSPELCSRSYDNITHMGAHGSSFLRDGSSVLSSAAGNQYENATVALSAGIRLLQAQVHKPNETLRLCHTSCDLLDAGTLESWLTKISYWMSQNPNDVVTLLLVNSDTVDADEFGEVFNSSGLADYAYTPSSSEGPSDDWPTLTEMIDDGGRLVTFITNVNTTSDYSYIMPEFDYMFETAYEVTELDGFNCTLDRPSGLDSATAALSSNYMSLVNHFKYQTLSSSSSLFMADASNIDIVNSANTTTDGNLGKHLKECKSEWSTKPNFVLVDMFEEGDVMVATDRMNGITNATGRITVASVDDSSEASGPSKNMGAVALIAFLAATITLV